MSEANTRSRSATRAWSRPISRASLSPLALLLAVVVGACGEQGEQTSDEGQGVDAGGDPIVPEGTPVWYGEVDRVVDQHCGACHMEGGSAPFALDTPEMWASFGMAAMNAIDAGRMPPWMPDPDCRDFEHERLMPAAEIEVLRDWMDAEQPVGDSANASAAVVRPTFEADLRLPISEPYLPDTNSADDYRCFVLDHTVTDTTFLTGSFVEPGNALVHHVLAYALTGSDAEAALAQDEADSGPGYTCFGGPVPSDFGGGGAVGDNGNAPSSRTQQIGAWVPGQAPNIAPEGIAMRLDAGARIVIQVHYSAVGGSPVVDSGTTLLLTTTSETPQFLRATRPVPVALLDIPAGDPEAVNQATLPYFGREPIVVRGLTGHMHLLGETLQADIIRADGGRECGLSIPEWDFSWQQSYTLAQENWITLSPGDAIELTCVYDNSAENQPIVDGSQVAPRDVTWGEGTLDEMCLLYLDTVTPYVVNDETSECPVECAERCADQGAACLVECAGADLDCVRCLSDGVAECGGAACRLELAGAQECVRECGTAAVALGSSFHECMTETCGDAYGAYVSCMDDVIGTPECTRELAGCVL